MADTNGDLVRRTGWLRQQAQELDFQCAVQRAVLRATLAPFQARLQAVCDRTVRGSLAA